jgi:hypothetical protein
MVWRSFRFIGLFGEQEKVNKASEIPGYVAAILVGGFGLAYLPQWGGLWGVLSITVLTVSGKRGPGFTSVIALSVIAVTIAAARTESLAFLLLSIIPGVVAGYFVTRSASLGRVLAGGFAAGVLGFGLVWLYQFFAQGIPLGLHSIETAFADYFNHTFLPTLEISGFSEYYDSQGLTKPMLKELFQNFLQGLAGLRPGLYILESWIRILLGVAFAKFLLRKQGWIFSPPFSLQRMAWQLDWVIILGLALWLSGQQWSQGLITQTGANVIFLMTPFAFYFGLSLTAYLIRHWKIRPWLLVIIGLATIFLPTQALLFITMLGVFDPLIDYRNLDGKRGSPA